MSAARLEGWAPGGFERVACWGRPIIWQPRAERQIVPPAERTGVPLETEHVCGHSEGDFTPRDNELPRRSLRPGLVSVRGLDWPGLHRDERPTYVRQIY
jgi:hypothetical protein